MDLICFPMDFICFQWTSLVVQGNWFSNGFHLKRTILETHHFEVGAARSTISRIPDPDFEDSTAWPSSNTCIFLRNSQRTQLKHAVPRGFHRLPQLNHCISGGIHTRLQKRSPPFQTIQKTFQEFQEPFQGFQVPFQEFQEIQIPFHDFQEMSRSWNGISGNMQPTI